MATLAELGKNQAQLEKQLAEYSGEDRIISSQEILERIKAERKAEGLIIKTDFPGLDNDIIGMRLGQLVIVSGLPGEGKTLLLKGLTKSSARQNIKSVWFSYEVTAEELLEGWPDMPTTYMPIQYKVADIDWLENRIREAILKYDIKMVFIDHLHYLVDMEQIKNKNTSLEIGAVARKLKTIANKLQVVIVLVWHTRKIYDKNEPDANSLRDTSFAMQEPDIVVIIWRIDDKPAENVIDQAWLKLLKCRRTGKRNKKYALKKIGYYLQEITGLPKGLDGWTPDDDAKNKAFWKDSLW